VSLKPQGEGGCPGVTWSPRTKATCPRCGRAGLGPYQTLPWEGEDRVRRHRCPDCGARFKSVEHDYTAGIQAPNTTNSVL